MACKECFVNDNNHNAYDPHGDALTPHEHAMASGHVHRLPIDPQSFAHIPGWGVDRNKQDRPAVPMERTPPRLEGIHWDTPAQQQANVEVLHSTERSGLTPVFGTTQPPRGVSGMLRRLGFRYSENDVRRWLTLLMADRVDMVEGVVDDLASGHVPNIYAEMGGRAELRHNPAGAARKAVTLLAVAGVAYWLWQRGDHSTRRTR
jgi:hypothetical protein